MSAAAGAAFAGAALVVAAPTDAQPASDDSELLAALAEFDALEQRIFPPGAAGPVTLEAEEARDIIIAPMQERQAQLLTRICTLRAATPEAWQARVRSFLLWEGADKYNVNRPDNTTGFVDDRLILALLRDMAGGLPA